MLGELASAHAKQKYATIKKKKYRWYSVRPLMYVTGDMQCSKYFFLQRNINKYPPNFHLPATTYDIRISKAGLL